LRRFLHVLSSVLLPVSLAFLSFCAHQIPPQGGPADIKPPAMAVTDPRNGSVHASTRKSVTFTFAEWIDPKTAEKGVSVFPPPPGGVKIIVTGKQLVIAPRKAFAESTTYHIEINTGLRDLHGNAIGTPYHLVFSTGAKLDSGKISGCVIDPRLALVQPKIALFAVPAAGWVDSLYFGDLSYLTQTDSSGRFALDFIRKGSFRILGFIDLNQDNKFQPLREEPYAPSSPEIAIDTAARALLFKTVGDTVSIKAANISAKSKKVIIGSWTSGDNRSAPISGPWKIESAGKQPAPRIQTVIALHHSKRFVLLLSDTLTLGGYRLIGPVRPRVGGDRLTTDTLRFNGTTAADTVPPRLSFSGQASQLELRPRIVLSCSEPARITGPRLALIDTLGDSVGLVPEDSGFGDSIGFAVSRSLKPGTVYALVIPYAAIEDLGGNHPPVHGDTAAIMQRIETIAANNLCTSLSGKGECLTSSDSRRWRFEPFGRPAISVADSAGAFRFDSLPSGKGRMAYFDDVNRNGRPETGELFPWQSAEPYIPFPDTIEARSRWDISGIVLPACEECRKRR
jgi:hypothetical protein